MWICNYCNTENDDREAFCFECGKSRSASPATSTNHCTNPSCTEYHVMLQNQTQKRCNKCGAFTTFGEVVDRQS